MKIGLVACTSRKKDKPMMVEKLYSNSPLFRYSVKFCKKKYDKVYALSTKYGLLPLNKVVRPYDLDPTILQRRALRDWLEMISEQIKQIIPENAELYFHAGKRFRKVIPYLKNFNCYEPMAGMGIGQQLSFYKQYFSR